MHHDEWDAECRCPPDFVDHSTNGFVADTRVVGSEIDQVATVRENGRDAVVSLRHPESAQLGGGERLDVPLHVVFEKNLDRVAADRRAAFHGAVEAACDRHVSAQWDHSLILDGGDGKSKT